MKFSHLHNHTTYSLLDGASNIKKLYQKAVADNMPAIAITDHGNMFGVFDFVSEAKKHKNDDGSLKVKPIVGCEFYVVENRHKQQFTKEQKDVRYHQLLLAKNQQGYKNIIKLCSLGYTEGQYGKYPRIDKELILQYHEGLIATTCCLGASVPRTILKHGADAGEKEFKWWLDIFGEDFYVELQRHDIPDQTIVNNELVRLAHKYNVHIIASNDSHYVEEEDSNAHDILLCINTNQQQSTPIYKHDGEDEVSAKGSRFGFPNNQFFFKSTAQMTELFSDIPEAIDNTNRIVDKVDLVSVTNDLLLPNFPVPAPFKTQEDYLDFLTWEGAKVRYTILTPEAEERIKFELGVIRKMGFPGYFLIVSDIIVSAKKMGVFVGSGRGSAAGSVVAYCIGITNIDPLKYNLLFERFLNPERASMPDIDSDFDDLGRQKVIDYIVKTYGRNQVAQIITYGTMAAKMSIKDVARVMELPLDESNILAKLVPDKPGTHLGEILKYTDKEFKDKEVTGEDIENIKKLQLIYQGDDLRATVLKTAEKLEGTTRNTGIHAAGIIIGPKDLTEIMPLCKQKDNELYVTQFSGNVIENAGAIKIDILGLSNLSILRDTIQFIRENHKIEIDLDNIPLDDANTYALYQRADTEGTFQFASAGMKKYMKELQPDTIEDLIAMNALYRPGPIAYIPEFIDRKHGRKKIEYDLPEMEIYLKETYGITVYQEQVMLLSQLLANFSKGQADILRKAMGKKQIDVLNKMKKDFIAGCLANNHPEKICEKIWQDWEAFAQYAFNKSHSTCYAYLAYQTAYFKANYAPEYMSALLNSQGNTEDIAKYMQECKRMGLLVLGPDVNESKQGFSVAKEGVIRFGLGAVKGVGEAAVEEILRERKENGAFTDIYDMVKRLSSRTVNKKTLESLVMAGAMDSFKAYNRATYFYVPIGEHASNLEKIIRYGQNFSASINNTSNSLFGDMGMPEIALPKIIICDEWILADKLENEKDMVGMYLSAHPLDSFQFEMMHYNMSPLVHVTEESEKESMFRVAGYISSAYHLTSKKGTRYGKFKLVDFTGEYEFVLFNENYVKYKDYLEANTKVMLNCSHEKRWGNEAVFKLKINSITLLENVKKILTKRFTIRTPLDKIDMDFLSLINKCADKTGNTEFGIQVVDTTSNELVSMYNDLKKIEISDELLEELKKFKEIEYEVVSL
jgi:DNA polymerase-3 subunit alpha